MTGRMLRAALLYFALVMATGFVLGAVRVPFLVPRLGERWAELIEMPLMFVAIVLAARHTVHRFALPPRPAIRLRVGFVALALSVATELLLATALQDRSVAAYLASRDPVSGSVYLLMLLLFAAMPTLLGTRDSRPR